jgi:hypothetical protein
MQTVQRLLIGSGHGLCIVVAAGEQIPFATQQTVEIRR